MVQEPSHVKQLSPIHVCKIGLNTVAATKFTAGLSAYGAHFLQKSLRSLAVGGCMQVEGSLMMNCKKNHPLLMKIVLLAQFPVGRKFTLLCPFYVHHVFLKTTTVQYRYFMQYCQQFFMLYNNTFHNTRRLSWLEFFLAPMTPTRLHFFPFCLTS